MFDFKILSPEGNVFEDSVEEVSLPTQNGEISVLTHHVPLFSKLTDGTITITKGGKKTVIAILGGFLEVKEKGVTVLSDYAVKADSIQTAKSMEAKKLAEEMLKNKETTSELLMAEKKLQKSLLELKVAAKIKHHQ